MTFWKCYKFEIFKIKSFSWENRNFQEKPHEMTPSQKFAVRWKLKLHYLLVLILSGNQTSMYEEHVPCDTFSYQLVFFNEKLIQNSKKSRCPWDGINLRASMFKTDGKPSTWFPQVTCRATETKEIDFKLHFSQTLQNFRIFTLKFQFSKIEMFKKMRFRKKWQKNFRFWGEWNFSNNEDGKIWKIK